MRLLLIRHGQSIGNAAERIQGHLDLGLSEHGRWESGRLAARVAALAVDALYCSPLLRARETAEIAFAAFDGALQERPALMERDVGELSGLSGPEVRERFPDLANARRDGGVHTVVPGYEPDDRFQRRVIAEVDALIERHPEGSVVAVTHGGVIGAFTRHAMSIPYRQPGGFSIGNTSISIFDIAGPGFDPERRPRVRLVSLNDTCHLDDEPR